MMKMKCSQLFRQPTNIHCRVQIVQIQSEITHHPMDIQSAQLACKLSDRTGCTGRCEPSEPQSSAAAHSPPRYTCWCLLLEAVEGSKDRERNHQYRVLNEDWIYDNNVLRRWKEEKISVWNAVLCWLAVYCCRKSLRCFRICSFFTFIFTWNRSLRGFEV